MLFFTCSLAAEGAKEASRLVSVKGRRAWGDYPWVEGKIRFKFFSIMLGFACGGDAVPYILPLRQRAH
jgi:hypothetical protein